MASSPEKPTRKHFDIARPGRSTPNATSRPTIVGHHTILQDPMVNTTKNDDDEPKIASSPVVVKTTIANLVPSEAAIAEHAAEVAEKSTDDDANKLDINQSSAAPVVAASQVEPAKTEAAEANPPAEEAKAPVIETQDSIDDDDKPNSDTSAEAQKKIDLEAKELQAKQEAIDQLIVDKTYYAPIGEKKRSRSKHHVIIWLVVIIILALALGDLLIDSGIIKTSFKPPISFFHNN